MLEVLVSVKCSSCGTVLGSSSRTASIVGIKDLGWFDGFGEYAPMFSTEALMLLIERAKLAQDLCENINIEWDSESAVLLALIDEIQTTSMHDLLVHNDNKNISNCLRVCTHIAKKLSTWLIKEQRVRIAK